MTAWLRQQTRGITAPLAVALFLLYVLSSSWRFPLGSDGGAMMATSRNLLMRQTLAVDVKFASDAGFNPSARIGVDGRAYVKYGLGLPIVELPFVAVALLISRFAPVTEAQALAVVLSLLNPLLSVCTAIAMFRVCTKLECPPAAALSVVAAYSFGTLAWVYAGVDGTEPLQALCLILCFLLLLEYRSGRTDAALFGSGFALAYAVVTKPANAILVPAFGLYVIAVCRMHHLPLRNMVATLVQFAFPIAIAILLLAWLNWFRFGSVLETGYEPRAFTNHFWSGIYGLTLSFNKGIIFYAPLVLIAPVGVGLMGRSHREEAALIVLTTLTYVSLFAKFYDWGGGWSWGPRYLMPIVPLLMVPVARACTMRTWQCVGAALFLAGAFVNGVGVLADGDAYHSAIMNVDLTDQTGFVPVGSITNPSQMLKVPIPPDYVLPEFSEIIGKIWIARVAWGGCSCDPATAACGCETGPLEEDVRFASPPWIRRYPQAHASPPYGSRLMNAWIAHQFHQALLKAPVLPFRP